MNLYLDAEFTELSQAGRLMSLALISDSGLWFYSELVGYGPVNSWIERNVEAYMFGDDVDALRIYSRSLTLEPNGAMIMLGASPAQVAAALPSWLATLPPSTSSGRGDRAYVWSDVLAYDWLHFCELFGGALNLPPEVFYIPFDVSTLLLERGFDPDAKREDFAGMEHLQVARKHNALWDALVLKKVCEKLGLPTHGRFTHQPPENQTA